MLKKKSYRKIVVLTGAGISAESGVKTFRDSDGLWESHSIEEVATPEGFSKNPELVYRFYNQRRKQLKDIKHNAAHFALVELENKFDGELLVVTQNVDDLHKRAGQKNLIHMHGELLKVRCLKSDEVLSWTEDLSQDDKCQCCSAPSSFRPHIVWFGEMPLEMDKITLSLSQCDLFVSIGTSGNVYPAAGFARQALYSGAETIELNLEPSSGQSNFSNAIYGPATEVVPAFVRELIEF